MLELAKRDPAGVVLALASMMEKTIIMPAHRMDDGEHEMRTGHSLFQDYAAVAESLDVYTPFDCAWPAAARDASALARSRLRRLGADADIMEHLNKIWSVGSLRVGETGKAAEAQAWLMAQPDRGRRLAAVGAARKAKRAPVTQEFSWVFNRPVQL